MRQVSYSDLKRKLSQALDEAAAGEELLVTRHRKPVARLIAAEAHLRVGARYGSGGLAPLLVRATKGRYLQTLLDDRRGEPG